MDVVDLDDTPPKSAAHQRPSASLAFASSSDGLERLQRDQLQSAPRLASTASCDPLTQNMCSQSPITHDMELSHQVTHWCNESKHILYLNHT